MKMTAELDVLEHVKNVWKTMQGNSPIYDFLFSHEGLVISSAGKGFVKAHLTIGPNHVNSRKVIHGSVSATIVDFFGGLAIATHGTQKTGASVDIHVSYLATATVGDVVEIEGKANKVGRQMAFTSVKITKLIDGKPGPIVVTASHTKFVA